MRRPASAWVGLGLLLAAATASASRGPSAGGSVLVRAGPGQDAAIRRALSATPLAEHPDLTVTPAARAAWPPIPGTAMRSRVLAALEPSADGRRWTLRPVPGAPELSGPLGDCLRPGAAGSSWPARSLAAAGVDLTISGPSRQLELRFDRRVDVLPELLAGCSLPVGSGGAFSSAAPTRFVARPDALGGAPFVHDVTLVGAGEPADIAVMSGLDEGGTLLAAPWAAVFLLVPDAGALEADPFGLRSDGGAASFHRDLAPELILAARHGGRGAGARLVLPPGVGPGRAPPPLEPTVSEPLALRPLLPEAPRLRIVAPLDDLLAADIAERLALLLRAKGWGVTSDPGGPTVRLVRWVPPSSDPALSMLDLSAQSSTLSPTPSEAGALLGGSVGDRVAAAVALEARWLAAHRVVPLLTAARWVTVHPRLHGVRVSPDGLPVIDDAWWSDP